MENHVVNLQDKIQKLIAQYTLDKKRLEEMEKLNNELTEENLQLMQQIEDFTKMNSEHEIKITDLQTKLGAAEVKTAELDSMLAAFDTLATEAIKQIEEFV
ncbi:MAG: hypothetical protein U1C33_01390, partial [Candidatus Cloacimonadaceae bacterium]|nr:hypothetical protein [Candidatus Cloacimonadaceae bacterium]